MCWSYLNKNRNWALFLSGVFFGFFLITLVFYLMNIEITFFGITITRQLLIIRMVVMLVIAYAFLKYAEKARKR